MKKNPLQRESSTFQSPGMRLVDSRRTGRYGELMVRTLSGIINCLPLRFTRGQRFSSIKQRSKQLTGTLFWKTMPQRRAAPALPLPFDTEITYNHPDR